MKRILPAAVVAALLICFPTGGKTIKSLRSEDGGDGPYKAIVVEDDLLPGHTIIRPENLKAAAKKEGKLPVILFGNGACARDSRMFYPFLSQIASYGYIVVTNGYWSDETNEQRRFEQAPAPPGDNTAPMQPRDNKQEALDLLNSLRWLKEQSKTRKSEYFKAVDTGTVIASGQSCGGLQALLLSSLGDSRIKTAVLLNSGSFPSQGGFAGGVFAKEDLEKISVPLIYIDGGDKDIAYVNGKDDFEKIQGVPVAFSNYPAGHMGTFFDEHGGEFARMAIMWLEYRIRGNKQYGQVFKSGTLPAEMKLWTLETKNF
ncbi:MAG: hypothetical protein IJV54_09365 [Bacteroidales bacterium]|nr:hypothetical protein [Bacteroidales bacterium]MBQ9712478.1 hypothetical protein [Bacteroidales bacterium]MBR1436508.1 hypothetical protein [Bacteroidales bacterium]